MLGERSLRAFQNRVYVVHPLGEVVALEFPRKDVEVDVGYGLPSSLAILEVGADEFRTIKSSLGLPDMLR